MWAPQIFYMKIGRVTLVCRITLPFCFSYFSSTGLVILKSGTHIHQLSTMLPQGNASEDYNVTIKLDISNQEGSSHEETLTVKVRSSKNGEVI